MILQIILKLPSFCIFNYVLINNFLVFFFVVLRSHLFWDHISTSYEQLDSCPLYMNPVSLLTEARVPWGGLVSATGLWRHKYYARKAGLCVCCRQDTRYTAVQTNVWEFRLGQSNFFVSHRNYIRYWAASKLRGCVNF